MEKLIEEFKRKMFLVGKSVRAVEVYVNSVKEFYHSDDSCLCRIKDFGMS